MRTWPVALGQLGSEVHSGADTQLSAGIGSRHIKSNSDVTCGADEASQAVWGTGRQWGKDWLSEPAQLVLLHELGCCTRGWHKWMFECACSPLGDTSLSIFCGPLFCCCSASPSLSLSPCPSFSYACSFVRTKSLLLSLKNYCFYSHVAKPCWISPEDKQVVPTLKIKTTKNTTTDQALFLYYYKWLKFN